MPTGLTSTNGKDQMDELYVNKYVVEMKTGHPGATTYTVVSTRDNMAAMARALPAALSNPAAQRAEDWSPSNLLWQQWATTADGRTSRVSLGFRVADDLAQYHVRRRFASRLRRYLRVAFWIALFAFAGIGICATLSGYVYVSPVIQGILFSIPMAGMAIGLLWLLDRKRAHKRASPKK